MDTKSLLIGIISFISGALLVSIAAVTFEKPEANDQMANLAISLQNKSGDDYDSEFISQMILHHEGAIDMAKLSNERANHPQIKQLSEDIIAAQEKEITEMKKWQTDWGYDPAPASFHPSH